MIELSFVGSPESVVARLREKGPAIEESLQRTIQRTVIGLESFTVADKLQGQVLNQRTGNLIRNLGTRVEVELGAITGTFFLGSTAWYGKIHEYGAIVNRTSKLGKSYAATYPERSFMRRSLREQAPSIREQLRQAVTDGIA